jgi:hypothetical protein
VIEQAGRALTRLFDGEDDAEKELLDLAKTLGILFGLPTNRTARAVEYLATEAPEDLASGELAEIPAGVVYGEREGQPKNPVTAFTK